jgi:hypothetical protein
MANEGTYAVTHVGNGFVSNLNGARFMMLGTDTKGMGMKR